MKVLASLLAILSIGAVFAAVPVSLKVRNGPECHAPNGGGLQPVLEGFVELLPLEEIAGIFLTAISEDEEVQAVMVYLESEEFRKIVSIIQETPEFSHLLKFACDSLYLDLYYYFNVLGGILGLPPVQRPFGILRRPGLHGMLLDIVDVLPIDALKAMFDDKLENDEYLQLAIETLKSEEFQNILKTLDGIPEFQTMLQELRGMGVDVDAVIDALRKFFDWN